MTKQLLLHSHRKINLGIFYKKVHTSGWLITPPTSVLHRLFLLDRITPEVSLSQTQIFAPANSQFRSMSIAPNLNFNMTNSYSFAFTSTYIKADSSSRITNQAPCILTFLHVQTNIQFSRFKLCRITHSSDVFVIYPRPKGDVLFRLYQQYFHHP